METRPWLGKLGNLIGNNEIEDSCKLIHIDLQIGFLFFFLYMQSLSSSYYPVIKIQRHSVKRCLMRYIQINLNQLNCTEYSRQWARSQKQHGFGKEIRFRGVPSIGKGQRGCNEQRSDRIRPGNSSAETMGKSSRSSDLTATPVASYSQ